MCLSKVSTIIFKVAPLMSVIHLCTNPALWRATASMQIKILRNWNQLICVFVNIDLNTSTASLVCVHIHTHIRSLHVPLVHHHYPSVISFPLTDQTAISLSNPSRLWKHTLHYISFEKITGSLMKYADNKRERGAGAWMT